MEKNPEEKKCKECSGRMVPGQLIDKSSMVSGPQYWARSASSILGIGLEDTYRIVSYRCEKCGYLMNYAVDDPEEPEVAEAAEEFEDKRELDPMMM